MHQAMSIYIDFMISQIAMALSGITIGLISGWNLGLVICCLMPILCFAGHFIMEKTIAATKERKAAYGDAAAIAQETLSAISTAFSFTTQNRAMRLYNEKTIQAEKVEIAAAKKISLAYGMMTWTNKIAYGVALWYGGSLIASQNAFLSTPGELVTCISAILTGTHALCTWMFAAVAGAKVSAQRPMSIIQLTNAEINLEKKNSSPTISISAGHLEFSNVEFAYPGRKVKVLHDISFKMIPGSFLGITGPSGGGKSTLLGLIERFYTPESGEIKLDGKDIAQLDMQSYRTQFGLVAEDPVLYFGSVYDNIAAGIDQVIEAQDVYNAAQLANIHNEIIQLPQGYETNVTRFSTGQRQRISLARALIRKPQILLLDEATSGLDNQSEAMVQQVLLRIRQQSQVTIISIAHRLSTIQHADEILVLDQGRIVDRGSHDELIRRESGHGRINLLMMKRLPVDLKPRDQKF